MKIMFFLLVTFLNLSAFAQETTTSQIIDPIIARLVKAAKVLNLPIDGYKVKINYYWEAAEFSMYPDGTLEIAAAYIPVLKTEDALASLLAHEFVHRGCDHFKQNIEPFAAEYEADRIGIAMLKIAGFNPYASIEAFQAYVKFYRKTTPGAGSHNDENHPDDDSRIAAIKNEIENISGKEKLRSVPISEELLKKVKCEINANMNGDQYSPNHERCWFQD